MPTWPRSILLLLLAACPGKSDETTSQATSSTGETDASSSSSTGEPTTGSSGAQTTMVDECTTRPGGDWNACDKGGITDNNLCGHEPGGGEGTVACLKPTSGNFSVCGIRDCVDDCDCFTPPTTGTALALCREVFGGGGKGCVLYCVNGQICPDGMECASGTCYWPG